MASQPDGGEVPEVTERKRRLDVLQDHATAPTCVVCLVPEELPPMRDDLQSPLPSKSKTGPCLRGVLQCRAESVHELLFGD